jgi:hypothetical protein
LGGSPCATSRRRRTVCCRARRAAARSSSGRCRPGRIGGARPTSAIAIAAAGVLAVSGIGWVVFSTSSDDSWSVALVVAGFWAAAGLIGWYVPRVGAIMLMAEAGVGFILAVTVAFTQELTQLGYKHPESAAPVFWTYFGWWFALPLAAALLFFLSADRENDRLSKTGAMNRPEGDLSGDWSSSKHADW